MQRITRVEKEGQRYTLHTSVSAPDGSFYLAYGQYGGPGYVARNCPDGTIAWEASVDTLRGVAVDDGGLVHAVGDAGEVVLDADGTELSRTAFAARPERFWADPSNGRILLMVNRQLVAADGGPLPQGLTELPIQDFMPSEDGRTLRLRTASRWVELDSSRILHDRAIPPGEGTGKVWVAVDAAHPLPNGATLLQMRRTIEIAAPHGLRGGGHMMFMRYPGGMEPFNGEYVSQTTFRKLDAAGKQVWETENLGESARFAVADDGTVFVAAPPAYKQAAKLSRVSDDGKLLPVAELSGAITGLSCEGEGLVVRHDRAIARVSRDGRVDDVTVPEGWTAQRFLADGRVLLHDNMSTAAAVLDPASGALLTLTDKQSDHSMGRKGELERVARELPPLEPGPGVVIEDEWVIVGDVRVPRN